MDDDSESLDLPHMIEADAAQTRLRHAVSEVGDQLQVNYDFGDDWWATLTVEKIFEDKELPGGELPRVLEGAGFGIVEDCGGVGGLDALVKDFKKKKGAEYKRLSEWLGVDDFDITAFDIDDMNFRLKSCHASTSSFMRTGSLQRRNPST